jgi:1-acyl-sn-glycerol-3-phosphate acyltransferase
LSLIRVKEYNKKPLEGKTFILTPNHTSDFDGPIYWSSHKNIRIVAKKECFEKPLQAKFLTSIDIIKVDRDTQEGRAMALLESLRYFKKKDKPKILLIFTQGTISDINKNTLGRFEDGPFAISALSNTPMVPTFEEQPRVFRKNRIVYGEPYVPDILNESRKVDREKLLEAKAYWQQKILELQQQAVELEGRPVRQLKLKPKHQNNNNG